MIGESVSEKVLVPMRGVVDRVPNLRFISDGISNIIRNQCGSKISRGPMGRKF